MISVSGGWLECVITIILSKLCVVDDNHMSIFFVYYKLHNNYVTKNVTISNNQIVTT